MSSTDPLEDLIGPPPTGLLVIFSPGSWLWITRALSAIYSQQQATTARVDLILAALGPLTQALEGLMSQSDQLASEVAATQAGVTNLASKFAEMATEIGSEIADLAAAIQAQGQPSQAVADAIASLQGTNSQLAALGTQASDLTSSLAADNTPTPPTP